MVMGTAVEATEAAVEEPQVDDSTIGGIVESDASETPENEVTDTPETDTPAPEATEQSKPDISALLGELNDDELVELPRFKDVLSKRQESARRKSERETSERLHSEKDRWVTQGQWVADLSAAYAVDDMGNVQVDTKRVNRITGDLAAYALNNAAGSVINNVNAAVDAVLPSGFTVTRDEQSELQELFADFKADPAKISPYVGQLLKVAQRSAIEEATPGIIAAERKVWEKEQATKAKAASVKSADDANAESGTPTNVGGKAAPGLNIQTLADAETAYNESRISHADFKKQLTRFGAKY